MPDGTPTTPTEIIHVKSRSVSCDGDASVLGHPKVFLKITGTQIMCPYCSKLFILEPGAVDNSH
ncbi:MAG: zinc-finger domain-containing protein [Acidocella sp.]|nr:zinc-finger domain-containing protein [Acidocella sp.]